jgi:hypothetical protein
MYTANSKKSKYAAVLVTREELDARKAAEGAKDAEIKAAVQVEKP